ncbi:MAG: DUF177 domain-containing protein, partial [Chitinispirillaceae bacterium]|nr:DUF177 domain-containing protein [Chitinispirillaceae bacterium]
ACTSHHKKRKNYFMIIDTSTIPEGHYHLEQLCDLASVRAELPPYGKGINCVIESSRSNNNILLEIKFSGFFELECSRCLESYNHFVSGEFSVTLKESNNPIQSPQGEDNVLFFTPDHSSVDLSSVLYEEIILSLPLKPLCKEECEGIKYQRNKSENFSDPRWERLKFFLKNDNNNLS